MAVTLTQSQKALVDQLQHLALSSVSHFPSTLIYGLSGIGKRKVVGQLADSLGLEVVEINASDSAEFVGTRLFGASSEEIAGQWFGGTASELARSGDAIIYLSAFDRLSTDEAFHQAIYRVLAKRTYVDPVGEEHRFSDGLWIIAAMRESRDSTSQASMDLDHWLCTHFEHQLRLEGPSP
jgi:MoxR-like ATPase